jgi:hypothetical protein
MSETPDSVDYEAIIRGDDSKLASQRQLWRANQCGLLELRAEPDIANRLSRVTLKEVLGEAARLDLWRPQPRGPRGAVRADG